MIEKVEESFTRVGEKLDIYEGKFKTEEIFFCSLLGKQFKAHIKGIIKFYFYSC